ncbi:hypothetical protein SEPCBS57363_001334 [Sporothrix epigloea]|uniref:L-tryptophan decarboxylase PsiD-like domain-containing protein n=1 Tax=Sporothrix epigloea TaxID=1892477 RepID=A0ABP0D9N6_9PEZI
MAPVSTTLNQQPGNGHGIPEEFHRTRPGNWLPADHRVQHAWLRKTVEHIDNKPERDALMPALQEFKEFIEASPRIYMYFTSMWDEVPHRAVYQRDPTGSRQIRDYEHMLDVLNHSFSRAPEWTDAAESVGMVGVPLCAIFDYAMGTPSGHAAFLDPDVNRMLKKILNVWGQYLTTPASAEVLGDHKTGWFGKVGLTELLKVANMPYQTNHKFEDMYICDPTAKYYGYKSWDDFFTRRVHDKARPIASPTDDSVINNACESRPYDVAHHAKLRSKFWIKGQPYSILDMLAHDPLAQQFDGATAYQAFLSALSYHRWHSPVSGTIKRAYVQEGTYFSEPLFEGREGPHGQDINAKGISIAQGYLTALATRAIIFIEADNPDIGLMAFIGVGMDEVSTCAIGVEEGQHINKGEELGMFHFGGSSHVLLFREGVEIEGLPKPGSDSNVPVRSCLGRVTGYVKPKHK